MRLKVESTMNGYIVMFADTIKKNGTYVFESIDILRMLEEIGEVVLGKKVRVEER